MYLRFDGFVQSSSYKNICEFLEVSENETLGPNPATGGTMSLLFIPTFRTLKDIYEFAQTEDI